MNLPKTKILFLFIFLGLSISSKGQVNLDLGLQAYFPFDGNPNDITSNAYIGMNNNATLTSDRFGNVNAAYDFTGGDKYINYGNVMNQTFAGIGNTFTISLWIKPSTADMSNNIIMAKVSDSGCNENERQFVLRLFDNQNLSFTYYSELTNGNAGRVNTTSSLTDTNQWYHIVVTYNGNVNSNDGQDRVNLYVNCDQRETVLETASGILGNIQPGNAAMGVGNYLNISGTSCQAFTAFEGIIDDIRIYNRLINEAEINALCTDETSPAKELETDVVSLMVYPNPTDGSLFIKDTKNNFQFYKIKNINGIVVQSGKLENQTIRFPDLVDGIYILELSNGHKKATTHKKIILNN